MRLFRSFRGWFDNWLRRMADNPTAWAMWHAEQDWKHQDKAEAHLRRAEDHRRQSRLYNEIARERGY